MRNTFYRYFPMHSIAHKHAQQLEQRCAAQHEQSCELVSMNKKLKQMWMYFEILSAKVEFLTQFNVTKYGKTGIELHTYIHFIYSRIYRIANMLSIVLQLHTSSNTLTERSISSITDKPWQTLRVYSSKTMHHIYLTFSVNIPAIKFSVKNR